MDTHNAYVWGVAASLTSAALHAGANVLDSYLSNKWSQRLSDVVALGAGMNLLFLPLCAVIDPPRWVDGRAAAVIVLISLINVFYHFPYYWSLQESDASVVSSLFSLGKSFTPLLAFVLLDERLA